ncbi:hypothetical protein [Microvirga sp. VF16]|uniref:hypothetical protein n=1 Tax=Microvirga sp. VF16 TaxID=2807101 RepID=UPI00193E03B7|nr:hypothetical protein [Microvirga sp. VF16]QRM35892.1 hypothetical protein JO965_46775 [Microvirga sp. VF16]
MRPGSRLARQDHPGPFPHMGVVICPPLTGCRDWFCRAHGVQAATAATTINTGMIRSVFIASSAGLARGRLMDCGHSLQVIARSSIRPTALQWGRFLITRSDGQARSLAVPAAARECTSMGRDHVSTPGLWPETDSIQSGPMIPGRRS